MFHSRKATASKTGAPHAPHAPHSNSNSNSTAYPRIDNFEYRSWFYPTNYDVRQYQVAITEQALFRNTLVCLPTGMGKTLVAAVVMHTYYKWFPGGTVVFLAPTKPLVAQQISACHSVMGIPAEDTAHLEGSISPEKRRDLWDTRRVIFSTPQTMLNDIQQGRLLPRRVVCLVVDEAHKATGQYAYTGIVKELENAQARFRVLALSATPGADMKRVQDVVRNLLIQHVEVRSEDDAELAPYRHDRTIETVAVAEGGQASVLRNLEQDLAEGLLRPLLGSLVKHGLVDNDNPRLVNFFTVEEAQRRLQENQNSPTGGALSKQVALKDLRSLVSQLEEIMDCRRALSENGLAGLLALIKRQDAAPGGCALSHLPRFQKLQQTLRLTQNDHVRLEKRAPKVGKLKEILVEHFARFSRAERSTRVIVFANLRATIHEIVCELADAEGVRAREFVGQATKAATEGQGGQGPQEAVRGQTQQEQQEVLRLFNAGDYNVLVATSIAEEGLDIAEVDLILLFDVSSSPIRLVQRSGRTGRKRAGRIIQLLQGAAEADKYVQSQKSSAGLSVAMKGSVNQLRLTSISAPPASVLPPELPRAVMELREVEVPEFRLSQVGGHASTSADGSGSGASDDLPVSADIRGYFEHWGQQAEAHLQHQAHQERNAQLSSAAPRTVESSSSAADVTRRPRYNELLIGDLEADVEFNSVVQVPYVAVQAVATAACELCGKECPAHAIEGFTLCPACLRCIEESEQLAIASRPIAASPLRSTHTERRSHNAEVEIAASATSNSSDTPVVDEAVKAYRAMLAQRDRIVQSPPRFRFEQSCLMHSGFGTITAGAYVRDAPDQPSSRPTSALASLQEVDNDENAEKEPESEAEEATWAEQEADTLIPDEPEVAPLPPPPPLLVRARGAAGFILPDSQSSPSSSEAEDSDANDFANTASGFYGNECARDEAQAGESEGAAALQDFVVESSEPSCSILSPPSPPLPPSATASSRPVPLGALQLPGSIKWQVAPSDKRGFLLPDTQDDDDENGGEEEREEDGDDEGADDCTQVSEGTLCEEEKEPKNQGAPPFPLAVRAESAFILPSSSESSDFSDEDPEDANDRTQADSPVSQLLFSSDPSPPPEVRFNFSVPQSGGASSAGEYGSRDREVTSGVAGASQRSSSQWDSADGAHVMLWEPSPPSFKGDSSAPIQPQPNQQRKEPKTHEDVPAQTASPRQLTILVKPKQPSARAIATVIDSSIAPRGSGRGSLPPATVDLSTSHKNSAFSPCQVDLTSDEDDAPCVRCLRTDCDDDDPMIFCDGPCGQCVHTCCYGLDSVPAGDFFCDSCAPERQKVFPRPRCALCFRSDGLMTRSHDHQYTHPVCVLWLSELTADEAGRAYDLSRLDPDRKTLSCSLCKKKGGGCLQCGYDNCLEAMHPHCAFAARRQMTIRADETGCQYALFCDDHAQFVRRDALLYSALRPVSVSEAVQSGGKNCRPSADSGDRHLLSDTQNDSAVLVDSCEKSGQGANNHRKRLRRVRDRASRGGAGHAAEEGAGAGKALQKHPAKKRDAVAMQKVAKYFDQEAALSGSASDDESCDEDGSQMEVLSGDFINDGEYTQATPMPSRKSRRGAEQSADGMALYYRVNCALESQSQMCSASGESPALRLGFRGAERGLPFLQNALRKQKARQKKEEEMRGAAVPRGEKRRRTSRRSRSRSRSRSPSESRQDLDEPEIECTDDIRDESREDEDGNDESREEEEEEEEGDEEEEEEESVQSIFVAGARGDAVSSARNLQGGGEHPGVERAGLPGSHQLPLQPQPAAELARSSSLLRRTLSSGEGNPRASEGINASALGDKAVRQLVPHSEIRSGNSYGALGVAGAIPTQRRLPLQALSKLSRQQQQQQPAAATEGRNSPRSAAALPRSHLQASNSSAEEFSSLEREKSSSCESPTPPVQAPRPPFKASQFTVDLTDEW